MQQTTPRLGNRKISQIAESQTLATAKKVRQLQEAGQEVLSLTLGEPDFDTPAHIQAAAQEALRAGHTHYPPVAGIPALRKAAARFFQAEHGLAFGPDNILVSTGAKQSLINVLMCLVEEGEEVIVPAPYWVSYYSMVQMAGGRPHVVQTDNSTGLKLTPHQLAEALSEQTRVLILNTPGNPTGAMYTETELAQLVEVLKDYPNVWILADEIYAMLRFDQPHISIGSFEAVADRTVTVSGVSKAFAMTGWRIGVMGAPAPVVQLCEKLQGQVTSGANSIAQYAATAAFEQPLHTVDQMRQSFHQRRDWCMQWLAERLPGFEVCRPAGTFYLYPDISAYLGARRPDGGTIDDVDQFVAYLLTEANVAVVTGQAFGSAHHIRISFATDLTTLDRAFQQMQAAVERLERP
jgi:aspartate aminotransferase